MKELFLAVYLILLCGCLVAQTSVWQPTPGHTQVPLWHGLAPDSQAVPGPENYTTAKELVGGKPWTAVANVSRPTMTVYSPQEKNTGAAVVVFPGGGYEILAIDLEGTEVCDWLTSKGITCVLLKYRVPGRGHFAKLGPNTSSLMALDDAQRTMGLVRSHAAEWHIDPHKIGVLGFSAGGHLSAAISTQFSHRLYPLKDAADRESCRPDFAVVLYPGHLWLGEKHLGLNPGVPVTAQTPPTFLVQAKNDPVDSVKNSQVYYAALKKAGVPAEIHLYAEGGHAFGLRRTKFPITGWPQLVEQWLRSIAVLRE